MSRKAKSIKLEILYRPLSEFGSRSDIAIHTKQPSYSELLESIDQALKDMFPRIVVYVESVSFHSGRYNIKASQSTWSRLIRDLGETADVRCGVIQEMFGQYKGDGFEIYFKAGA